MDRPILFSAPMVRAILSGAKTQTRRIVKPQPFEVPHMGTPGLHWSRRGAKVAAREGMGGFVWDRRDECRFPTPYGQPGDRLWVRETHGYITGAGIRTVYRADGEPRDRFSGEVIANMKWRPSIFMRRHDSRITLEVTGVRVERVQDISEEDARAEGVEPSMTIGREPGATTAECISHVHALARLWNQLNGAESWNANPWVWVVSFKRIEAAAGRAA